MAVISIEQTRTGEDAILVIICPKKPWGAVVRSAPEIRAPCARPENAIRKNVAKNSTCFAVKVLQALSWCLVKRDNARVNRADQGMLISENWSRIQWEVRPSDGTANHNGKARFGSTLCYPNNRVIGSPLAKLFITASLSSGNEPFRF